MDTFNQHKIAISIGGILGLFLIAAVAWYWTSKNSAPAELESGAVSIDLSGVTATSGPVKKDGYTIELESVKSVLPKTPSLDRTVPETPTLSSEVRATLLTNLSRVVGSLRKNPEAYGDWLDLGALRQTLGDYIGAEEAWKYAAALSPSTGVAYANLGNLYATYLKDYKQAEANYLKGIANDPRAVNTYRNLFDLYVYSYKQNTSAAEDILKSGVAKLPKAVDLQVLLARYYRDRGRTTDARVVYGTAIATAEAAGNSVLAAELRAEEAALK